MDLFRQCVNALFQPVDLPLNSFEPFALVDLPPVLEDAKRVGLNARDMLVAPMLQRGHPVIQLVRCIFHTVQKHDAGNDQNQELDRLSCNSGYIVQQQLAHTVTLDIGICGFVWVQLEAKEFVIDHWSMINCHLKKNDQ